MLENDKIVVSVLTYVLGWDREKKCVKRFTKGYFTACASFFDKFGEGTCWERRILTLGSISRDKKKV